MKYQDLKPGDTVILDGGFTCHPPGPVTVKEGTEGLYFDCASGQHFIDGQKDEDGTLIGLSWPPA